MNHPMGEESTRAGEPCSPTYHLSSKALYCGRASPDKLRPGRTFEGPRAGTCAAGSGPVFFVTDLHSFELFLAVPTSSRATSVTTLPPRSRLRRLHRQG